jgi:hypothetical protein
MAQALEEFLVSLKFSVDQQGQQKDALAAQGRADEAISKVAEAHERAIALMAKRRTELASYATLWAAWRSASAPQILAQCEVQSARITEGIDPPRTPNLVIA